MIKIPRFMYPESPELKIKMISLSEELIQVVASCSKENCAQIVTPKWDRPLGLIVKLHFSQSSTLRRQFSLLTSVSERLSLFLDDVHLRNRLDGAFEQCKKMVLMPCTCHKKNVQKAVEIRLIANKTYSSKLYLIAFRFYTSGIMWAPELSDEAAILYGNRSAAFYQTKQYENALEDIERAFNLGYALLKPNGKGKLLIRKAECLLELGRVGEAKEMFKSKQPLEDERWKELKELAQNTKVDKRSVNLFKFQETSAATKVLIAKGKFTSHGRFSWLNGKVELCYNAEKGFQLFARKDLAYGEVAAIGEPFVSWAQFTGPSRPHQCHYCLIDIGQADGAALGIHNECELELVQKLQGLSSGPSRCFAPFPCTVCPNVLFCSDVCRRQAWDSFHRFECPQELILNSFNHQARLAMRMLYSVGSLERIKQVAKDWDDNKDHFEMMKNPRDYAFIYGMRQDEECDSAELFRLMATATFLTKLAQFSGFIDYAREDELFTIRILLRHLLQLKANVTMPPEEAPGGGIEDPTRLHGIATLMGKSSRKANIARFWIAETAGIQSNTHLFYVARPIKAGEELLIFADNNHRMLEAEEDLQFDVLLTSPAN